MEACIRAETHERACTLANAEACAEFARALQPGAAGNGLNGSPDCVACLDPKADTSMQAAFAEQQKALDGATLTVHTAKIDNGKWPADLADQKTKSTVLAKLDVELTNYGYRIDPDDFVIVEGAYTVASGPYTERLTHAGQPVAWTDPSIVNEPDLRIVAYFVLSAAARGRSFAVSYNGKVSRTFELR